MWPDLWARGCVLWIHSGKYVHIDIAPLMLLSSTSRSQEPGSVRSDIS